MPGVFVKYIPTFDRNFLPKIDLKKPRQKNYYQVSVYKICYPYSNFFTKLSC